MGAVINTNSTSGGFSRAAWRDRVLSVLLGCFAPAALLAMPGDAMAQATSTSAYPVKPIRI
ncbi:MAG: hypothetical protein JWO70_4213, partial [Betaproteobacteria bacterium]|nr:hypothetical protein [Betaproteobacteria bacterium]